MVTPHFYTHPKNADSMKSQPDDISKILSEKNTALAFEKPDQN